MEKKLAILLAAILSIAPGCKKRLKKTSLSTAQDLSGKKSEVKTVSHEPAVLDEDLDDFVFVSEEEANPFDTAMNTDESSTQETVLDAEVEPEEESPALKAQKKSIKTIYYGFDKYDISSDQKGSAEHVASRIKATLKKNPKAQFVVEGHACRSAGSDSYNLALSNRRGQGVINYLGKNGVSRRALKLVGRGSEMPIVPEGSLEEQAPNRRVEIFEREISPAK